MRTFALVTSRSWNEPMAERLGQRTGCRFALLTRKDELTAENLGKLNPEKIFVPHWSHLIPAEVFSRFETVIFHMTDLPFGRGGSPLQNLIARGIYHTKISALRCEAALDAGPIYLKSALDLGGSAREIFARASAVIEEQIFEIVTKNPAPKAQEGEPVVFTRRKPEESDLSALANLTQVYDYIRMLDADGYPSAFVESGPFRFEFTEASVSGTEVEARVKITLKGKE